MASSLAHADESSGLPKGTLKDVRGALEAWSKEKDPKGHKAHKKKMAKRAAGYIENAPLEVLLKTVLRRIMAEKAKVGDRDRKRNQRARQKTSS